MAVHEKLAALSGEWKGKNRLNMSWEPDPIKESASTASVSTRAGQTCLEIAYTWEFEGKPQEGFIVIAGDTGSDKANAVWTDSWHSANVLMNCSGSISGGGANLKGFYKVEGHPDWGWRTEIIPGGDKFKYLMFNVTPEGHGMGRRNGIYESVKRRNMAEFSIPKAGTICWRELATKDFEKAKSFYN